MKYEIYEQRIPSLFPHNGTQILGGIPR